MQNYTPTGVFFFFTCYIIIDTKHVDKGHSMYYKVKTTFCHECGKISEGHNDRCPHCDETMNTHTSRLQRHYPENGRNIIKVVTEKELAQDG